MQPLSRLSHQVQKLLRCPKCHAPLNEADLHLKCTASGCAAEYPIVQGIPVLIHEQSSVFSLDDFVSQRATFFADHGRSRMKSAIVRCMPKIGRNIEGRANYRRLVEVLLGQSAAPRVLVIGGSILGQGMEALADHPAIELVESDVAFGPRTALICDAHDIPFEDGSFDGVIVQAVLEHVVDPYRCSEEIHRVLSTHGIIYAETPFMQQVHGGRYDFTRFTHLGHRRLFRRFEEIDSGAVCGPGMALAWSYQYFLLSFASSRKLRAIIQLFASFTSFFLKYFDYLLINTPGTLDAASGYYFMGKKTTRELPDKELIQSYRGAG